MFVQKKRDFSWYKNVGESRMVVFVLVCNSSTYQWMSGKVILQLNGDGQRKNENAKS